MCGQVEILPTVNQNSLSLPCASCILPSTPCSPLKMQCGKADVIHTTKDLTPNDKRRAHRAQQGGLSQVGTRPKAGLEIAVSNELTAAIGGRALRKLRPKENLNPKLKTKKTGGD